ncbi:hypothetical protein MBLNU457_6581t2 [Dothideomycetes sp. NU457]
MDIINLEVGSSLTIADLKSYINAETGFDISRQLLYFNGHPVQEDSKTLEELNIKDGEMIALLISEEENPDQSQPSRRGGQSQSSGARDGGAGAMNSPAQIESMRQACLRNPAQLAQIRQQQPDLADAVHDQQRFKDIFERLIGAERDRERERQNQMRLLNEDPFNVEAQRKIEEIIRQDRVMENLQHAYEHNPEVFGRVHMLYINSEVNGRKVKAFVDSGAQTTIMSPSCAEACGIMRLIDTRYSGVARGVGTAKILGRVHSADIRIGNAVLPCSFTVMEGKDVDLLLGLDMLKRYQGCIDLKRNKLVFDGNEVDFLPENEIPKWSEEAEPTISGPDGTEIGTQSGTVKPAGSSEESSNSKFRGAGQTLGSGSKTTPQPVVQPTPATASTSAQRPAQQQQASHPKEAIDQLQSLGFSRQEAIAALDATGGNVEYAAGLLFQG